MCKETVLEECKGIEPEICNETGREVCKGIKQKIFEGPEQEFVKEQSIK